MPSELTKGVDIGGLLVLLGFWNQGPYINPDQQGDTSEITADDNDDANKSILHSPPKPTLLFPLESPDIVRTEINRYKDNPLYLSPTTHRLHDSIKKASISTQPVYNTKWLREARKNIIQSVDHILNHNLVRENPLAAKFVSDMDREVQNIKDWFNTKILSILGSRNGQDNELCFPSFNNKKMSVVEKRFKGYAG